MYFKNVDRLLTTRLRKKQSGQFFTTRNRSSQCSKSFPPKGYLGGKS
jgi:hypothetical protein